MNQKIFTMNLGVEAVSLYLLCCALADSGAAITVDALQGKWNGSPAALERELHNLEKRRILHREEAPAQNAATYLLMADKHWR